MSGKARSRGGEEKRIIPHRSKCVVVVAVVVVG